MIRSKYGDEVKSLVYKFELRRKKETKIMPTFEIILGTLRFTRL